MSTEERIRHADVLLSTAWAPEVTATIVQKAYNSLLERAEQGGMVVVSGEGEVVKGDGNQNGERGEKRQKTEGRANL